MSIRLPRESDLVKQCLRWLHLNGYHVWRQNSGAMKIDRRYIIFCRQKGVSDILGWVPWGGKFLAVETKRRGQKPTPSQQKFLDDVNHDGGIGLVVHSLDELIAGLKERMP